MQQVIELPTAHRDCHRCNQSQLCLSADLCKAEQQRFASTLKRIRKIERSAPLFAIGDDFSSLYIVRSGSVKVYTLSAEGEEQVLGFYLPGDWLGLEALGTGCHGCGAIALETSSVCELSFQRLEQLAQSYAGLQQQLHRLYSREIARDYALLRLLGRKSAEQRLSGFLLELSTRFAERGFSAETFNLSMSRHDIGNYLGLAIETISRLFARLQEDNVLRVERRNVTILNQAQLQLLAGVPANMQQRCRLH